MNGFLFAKKKEVRTMGVRGHPRKLKKAKK